MSHKKKPHVKKKSMKSESAMEKGKESMMKMPPSMMKKGCK